MLTLLEENQIFGEDKLKVIKKYGEKAAITDFGILLGGYVSDVTINGSRDLKDRTGWYWTKTDDGDNAVDDRGLRYCDKVYKRNGGCRPALPFSSISSISSNVVRGSDEILRVEYGEYPQYAVSKEEQIILENLYNSNLLNSTGKRYTTDSRKCDDYDKGFSPKVWDEYEYNGKKFVRVVGNSDFAGNEFKLSNGEKYKDGDAVWVEVSPIKWIVDEEEDIAISEKLLVAGIQFDKKSNYKGAFSKTNMYNFLSTYLSNEIVQNNIINQNTNLNDNKNINPYNLLFENVSEEDIIKGCVLSGITPYIHGKSSDGKSARVKQLDKDCEIIYLRIATLESLIGKSVYNQSTGEMIDIPPTWYKRLKEKCDKEPDKIHILFLDELADALHAIQSMAFNLILDREVDGKWKLPDNARIVAAGNEVSDSISANEIAEPLFNRLAHVYINTTVDDWLKWASTPDSEYEKLDLEESKVELKIHPAIYSFISYKRDSALRTEFNGKTPNADPRKWEMASKVLYQTKNPKMLRALIGKELTGEFVNFCNQKVLTLEDVIKGNYTDSDLNMNLGQKYSLINTLSYVDEENLIIVRDFIKKIEPEYLALFDNLWSKGDISRLEKIAELRIEGGMKK